MALDLAAQWVDLDVDRALADFGIVTGEFITRHSFADPYGEDRQGLLLAAARPPPRLSSRLDSVPCVPQRS